MRVVGIDQSYSNFGYSIDGNAKKKGFPASKFDTHAQRLGAIRDWFQCWIEDVAHGGLDLVAMEGYSNASKFGRELSGELGGVVKLVVWDAFGANVPLLVVPPTSLKKFVTGSGGAAKNQMLLHVYRKWGVEFADDNQADAYALEQFGKMYLDPTRVKYNYEAEVIKAVRKAQ